MKQPLTGCHNSRTNLPPCPWDGVEAFPMKKLLRCCTHMMCFGCTAAVPYPLRPPSPHAAPFAPPQGRRSAPTPHILQQRGTGSQCFHPGMPLPHPHPWRCLAPCMCCSVYRRCHLLPGSVYCFRCTSQSGHSVGYPEPFTSLAPGAIAWCRVPGRGWRPTEPIQAVPPPWRAPEGSCAST